MMFEVSTARKAVLEKLAEQPWTPTDLAEELGKSRNTTYNHLEELHQLGILTKTQVAAKTRPKTEYSIGDGFVQYLAVLPGQYTEKSIELTPEKEAVLRIWNVPQERFHPFAEAYWWRIKNDPEFDYRDDVNAVAIYGSVARGDADDDSDIDFLVITDDEATEETISEQYGSTRIEAGETRKIGMTQVYTLNAFRNSVARGSGFLANIQDELHVIYDPDNILRNPATVVNNE